MWRIATIVLIIVGIGFGALRPGPVAAQGGETCVSIAQGVGRGPVTITVPSWARRLRFDVAWAGLQLRVFLNRTVHGLDMYGDGSVRTIYTGVRSGGWGGSWQLEYGGIAVDGVGAWAVYACGAPPPTPTPSPTPTTTPTPTPIIVTGPGCISRVGERAVWVGEGGVESLTLYGPATGWWIVQITEDTGASGAQYVGWRVTTSSGLVLADRTGNGEIEVRAGMTVTITPYRTPLTTDGLVGVWVAITADCSGLVSTPLVPDWLTPGEEDIREVQFGIETANAPTCIIELPYVAATFSLPFVEPFTLSFPGVRLCFLQQWLVLRWGDFNLIDWAIPLLTLGLVWSAWLSLRRG